MYWLPIGRIGQMLQLCPKPPHLSLPLCLPSPYWLTLSPSLLTTRKPHSCSICLLGRASPCLLACPSLTWLPLIQDNSPPCLLSCVSHMILPSLSNGMRPSSYNH